MITEPVDDAGAVLAAARAGCRESTGQALERFRRYLLAIANHQLDPELRAKGGASDLVQETFLEAQRDLQRFQGSSTEELRAWLRQILVHNVGAFSRRFRVAEMRTVAARSRCRRTNLRVGTTRVWQGRRLRQARWQSNTNKPEHCAVRSSGYRKSIARSSCFASSGGSLSRRSRERPADLPTQPGIFGRAR